MLEQIMRDKLPFCFHQQQTAGLSKAGFLLVFKIYDLIVKAYQKQL